MASQKTANETYFASLGQANAHRSADLHPSQGGKYTGFGSSPMPSPGQSNSNAGSHPSNITSSRALPTFNDLQSDPLKAMSKGWGLFSNTLSQATKTINESVIQPGLVKINDPNLSNSLQGYYSKGGEFISYGLQQGQAVLGEGIKNAGEIAKSRGVDTSYLDRFGNVISTGHSDGYEHNNSGNGAMAYDSLSHQEPHQTSLESQEAGFADLDSPPISRAKTVNQTYPSYGTTTSSTTNSKSKQEEEDFFDSHLKTSGASTPSNQNVEDGFKSMSIGNGSTSGNNAPVKRPIGRKGLGAVRSATPPIAKKKNDDDEWAKFD